MPCSKKMIINGFGVGRGRNCPFSIQELSDCDTRWAGWDEPSLFFQGHLVLSCPEFISCPHFEGIVLLLMADGEIKADGVVISLHQVADDLVRRTAEGPRRVLIFAEAADDQPGQPVQPAA